MSYSGGPYGPGPGWTPPARRRGPDSTDYVLVAGGGILLAVSTVLPWVTVSYFGTFDLFRWTEFVGGSQALPWLMIAAGLALAVGAYRRMPVSNLALGGFVTAIVTGLVGFDDVDRILRAAASSRHDGLVADVDLGLFVAGIGLVLLIVAAVRVHLRYRTPTGGSGGARRSPGASWGRPGASSARSSRISRPTFGRSVFTRQTQPRPITESPPPELSPGWKPDPWGVGNSQRYWDGRSWTNQTNYRP